MQFGLCKMYKYFAFKEQGTRTRFKEQGPLYRVLPNCMKISQYVWRVIKDAFSVTSRTARQTDNVPKP